MVVMRAPWIAVGVIVAVVSGCSGPPDFQAFCAKAAPCEGKTVAACVEDRRRLWEEQKERGCGAEGAAIVRCEIQHGRCESAGGWSLFMPTDACLGPIKAFEACLDRTRK